jgi:hypothetical protein
VIRFDLASVGYLLIGVAVAVVALPPGERTWRAAAATAIGALAPFLFLGLRFGDAVFDLGIGVETVAVVAGGAGLVLAAELVAVVAGRGHRPPFLRAAPYLGVIAGALIGFPSARVLLPIKPSALAWATLLGGIGALVGGAWWAGRRGGSVIVACLLYESFLICADDARPLPLFAVFAAPPLLGLLALRLVRFGRRERDIFGFTAFSAGDLALVPMVMAIGAGHALAIMLPALARPLDGAPGSFALTFAAAAAFFLCLRYLRRRLDLAEEHAARTAGAVA